LGEGVIDEWLGRRVWCYGAQSYRPFGTAAEYTVLPLEKVVPLPDGVPFEQGACLGIPALTAHRAVHVAGPVKGRTVLVQGGAGAVGLSAVQLAYRAGARVIATVRRASDESLVRAASAAEVVLTTAGNVVEQLQALALAPDGVDHVVEVAFAANLAVTTEVLAVGGSVAAYATDNPAPELPFWELLFKNARIFLVGSDDFPLEVKRAAATDINAAFAAGWGGYEIAERLPLTEIAKAHELVERPSRRGRVVLML
jgi:NADPH2:quinone reductase